MHSHTEGCCAVHVFLPLSFMPTCFLPLVLIISFAARRHSLQCSCYAQLGSIQQVGVHIKKVERVRGYIHQLNQPAAAALPVL